MIRLTVTVLILFGSLASANDSVVPIPFVEEHCLECHDDLRAEGRFRADLLGLDLSSEAKYQRWSRVLARVQSGEMPPPETDEPPNPAEREKALLALKTAFYQYARAKNGERGRVRIRRLNRLEYENTVQDLLGIETPLQDLHPEDDLRDGFANNPEALSISPVHIQQYMAAGKNQQPLCNLYTSMLRMGGVEIDRFSTGTGPLKGLEPA